MTTKVLTRRQARWAERLADFDFTIKYRAGKLNDQADALSRQDDVFPKEGSSYAAVNPENHRSLFEPRHLRAGFVHQPDLLFEAIRNAQKQDPHIIALRLQVPTDSRYSIEDDILLFDKRIYVAEDDKIKLQILQSRHDHPTSGHPGVTKTLLLVRQDFYWPNVCQYVVNYVDGCTTCQRTKTFRHRRYGLLQPLPIPKRPWSSLSMDYIDQLPLSNDFDAILVVVDRLTKMALFIPSKTTNTAKDLARQYVQHVFSKHGLPTDIVSNRGSKFTSSFWTSLSKSLGIRQNLSTAYHPETDGQTERINQIVETYLRLYINYNQDDWVDFLPLAEFAYNNSPHSSTTESPFFLNKGFSPTLDVKISSITKKSEGVAIARIHELHEHAKAEIKKALAANEVQANKKRIQGPTFEVGTKAYLSTQNICTTRPTKKFAERRLGPFLIEAKVSELARRLQLPDYLLGIHPVFHISLLEPAKPDLIPGRIVEPPPPVVVDDQLEYEVEAVLDSKGRGRHIKYLVKWNGYDDDEIEKQTWEPPENVSHAKKLVDIFHRTHPTKPKPISN